MIEKGGIWTQKGIFEMIGSLAGMHPISIGCGVAGAIRSRVGSVSLEVLWCDAAKIQTFISCNIMQSKRG